MRLINRRRWNRHVYKRTGRALVSAGRGQPRAPAEELDKLLAPADDPQVDDTLPRAIMALPRPYREVIILHYYQELKAREIADILHINVSTVTARLSRARNMLRESLKGWYYDE